MKKSIATRLAAAGVIGGFLIGVTASPRLFADDGVSDAGRPETVGSDAGPFTDGEMLFALKVKPLFASKCMACHGDEPDEIQGGFDMRTRESMLAGGDTFEHEGMIPGQGETSYLYRTTTRTQVDYEMPPKEADRLSEQQQWWIRDWIDAGAPWPDRDQMLAIEQEHARGEQVLTSKALSDDWQNRRYESEKLWAYRPLARTTVPENEHPVDWFLDQKRLSARLPPAPPTTAGRFVRRLHFGLTGLPPSPEQIDSFSSAYASDPDSAVRDRARALMESPHYGEHFGLRWLDVVRYADSAGFANDYCRPNAWRYRDYVVRAFNDDKPYDDFVREQIAGDEIDPNDSEHLIATGFLRMGPWEQTSMSVFKETRQQWLDDVTDSVGQTFLGHAMQCAKCHDHKFDPVPTRDYYRMMAVFSTTQFAQRDAPFLDSEQQTGFAESERWVNAKIAAYESQQKELKARVARDRKAETGVTKVGDNGLAPGDEASLARMGKNIARHRWELDRGNPVAMAVYTGKTVHRKSVNRPLALPANPWQKGTLEKDVIFGGGSVYSPTDPVTPGALSVAETLGGMQASSFPTGKGRRRLALADWIVDSQNPLTARVIVNRVWSWHFGKGIAANPNNLGGTGGLPTHPELLDYLAAWFMEQDWSIKRLNELIVTSAAYRQCTVHPLPERIAQQDPTGQLYASFPSRRLTAEEMRDAMLLASGELNQQVGGIPARPDMNQEVAFQPRQIMGGTASVYEPDPRPEQRNRRSLYAEKVRGLRDPFFESFNQPGPDKSCELRETSTVAPQALTLFNSAEVHDRAIGLAIRLRDERLDDEATIHRAFELTLGRAASEIELALCLDHWTKATSEESSKQHQVPVYPKTIDRTVMAEKTGQPYTFQEVMPAYANYQPDAHPADVDAKTRGLAQIGLVLFNLNEFAYLD